MHRWNHPRQLGWSTASVIDSIYITAGRCSSKRPALRSGDFGRPRPRNGGSLPPSRPPAALHWPLRGALRFARSPCRRAGRGWDVALVRYLVRLTPNHEVYSPPARGLLIHCWCLIADVGALVECGWKPGGRPEKRKYAPDTIEPPI